MSRNHRDEPGFCGLFGRRSKNGQNNRVYQRYQFLRERFGLGHEEAQKLARELEKWWPDGA